MNFAHSEGDHWMQLQSKFLRVLSLIVSSNILVQSLHSCQYDAMNRGCSFVYSYLLRGSLIPRETISGVSKAKDLLAC
jgi:hypothetical protein